MKLTDQQRTEIRALLWERAGERYKKNFAKGCPSQEAARDEILKKANVDFAWRMYSKKNALDLMPDHYYDRLAQVLNYDLKSTGNERPEAAR